MRGFKNFLMQGDLIVIAVGLSIALAFSTLIEVIHDRRHHAARECGRRQRRQTGSGSTSTVNSSTSVP